MLFPYAFAMPTYKWLGLTAIYRRKSGIISGILCQKHYSDDPRERERVSKRASEQAAERASERASERDRVAQGRWSESGTLSRRAAAAGLAPDVKFSCGKAQLYFTV